MAARRIDQGHIFIAYSQPVEIVKKFETKAMPAAQHSVSKAVAGHEHHFVAGPDLVG